MPVSSLIWAALPVTASLVAVSAVFCVVITVPLASLAAARQDRPADHAVRVFSLVGLGMPSFFLGIILIIVFAVDLHWFSVGGWGTTFAEHLRSLVLPGLTAAIAIAPVLIRSLRVGMLEVIESDFVAAARAKGLRGPRVLLAHVARNALIPTVTLLGINIAYLIGSTVVIERVFDLNGLGNLMLNAIGVRDFPVVQGVTIVYAIAVVVINLLTDLVAVSQDWVAAAEGGGLSRSRVLLRHVLPNTISQAIVYVMSDIVLVILAVVTLGYLGLGIQPPAPDWGAMISDGQAFITVHPWLSIIPGIAVILVGVGLSLLEDGLADLQRPR